LFIPKPGWLEFCVSYEDERRCSSLRSDDGFPTRARRSAKRFGITPDISTFGKIIGGGLPVGAFGGRADIADFLATRAGVSGRHVERQSAGDGGGHRGVGGVIGGTSHTSPKLKLGEKSGTRATRPSK
jgi:hypothetical protein